MSNKLFFNNEGKLQKAQTIDLTSSAQTRLDSSVEALEAFYSRDVAGQVVDVTITDVGTTFKFITEDGEPIAVFEYRLGRLWTPTMFDLYTIVEGGGKLKSKDGKRQFNVLCVRSTHGITKMLKEIENAIPKDMHDHPMLVHVAKTDSDKTTKEVYVDNGFERAEFKLEADYRVVR